MSTIIFWLDKVALLAVTVAMTLQAYLKAKRLQDTKFAATVGVSRAYISQLRRGLKDNPSIDLAKRIQKATGGNVPVTAWATRRNGKGKS